MNEEFSFLSPLEDIAGTRAKRENLQYIGLWRCTYQKPIEMSKDQLNANFERAKTLVFTKIELANFVSDFSEQLNLSDKQVNFLLQDLSKTKSGTKKKYINYEQIFWENRKHKVKHKLVVRIDSPWLLAANVVGDLSNEDIREQIKTSKPISTAEIQLLLDFSFPPN